MSVCGYTLDYARKMQGSDLVTTERRARSLPGNDYGREEACSVLVNCEAERSRFFTEGPNNLSER